MKYTKIGPVLPKKGGRVLPNLLNTPQKQIHPLDANPSDGLIEEAKALGLTDEELIDLGLTEEYFSDPTEEDLQRMRWFRAEFEREKQELEAIKANRPLGSVVHREPKSLHYSKVPEPVWKRKLRP